MGEERKKMQGNYCDVYDGLGESLWDTILSLLPFHEAVKTSILSKAWQHSWTSIPYLDIDPFLTLPPERMEEEEKKATATKDSDQYWAPLGGGDEWIRIVDKIFASHPGNIQKCRISTWYSKNGSNIDRWISELMKRSIAELVIESGGLGLSYKVPHILFQHESLKKLELHGCAVNLPSFISLKYINLRMLKLHNTDISIGTLQRFLSQCGSLESLTLQGWYNIDVPFLNISAPYLRDLDINFCSCSKLKRVRIDAPNLKNVKMDNSVGVKVEIHPPLLETSKCWAAANIPVECSDEDGGSWD
ncbi:F-box/FBD/LRR-repeat protein At1g13570-like [Magnolia sinica]|uniref:F-box/FBD/LRR-repeat protein At1g13570-like n=1 Tax=Magnolia sinica TaxID=86752 RepID=UPI002658C97F|nr:F-box/FBD/LRR-repeat protein At1g13570-like [Magnolia sinica]